MFALAYFLLTDIFTENIYMQLSFHAKTQGRVIENFPNKSVNFKTLKVLDFPFLRIKSLKGKITDI